MRNISRHHGVDALWGAHGSDVYCSGPAKFEPFACRRASILRQAQLER